MRRPIHGETCPLYLCIFFFLSSPYALFIFFSSISHPCFFSPLYFPDILMCIVQSVRVVGVVAVVAVAVVVKSGRLLVFELGCTALSSLILSFSVL